MQDAKETLTDTRFYSKVKMTFEMTGQLKCTACNILGCESSIQNALVSGKDISMSSLVMRFFKIFHDF